MRIWRAAFAATISCLCVGAVTSAWGAPRAASAPKTTHQLLFGAGSDNGEITGRGLLEGLGNDLGSERMLPLEPPEYSRLARFHYYGKGMQGKGFLTLAVHTGRFYRNGTISKSLQLSVEVIDSSDPDCREATATRAGARGTVVLSENGTGSKIELDLPCGVHREWTGDDKLLLLAYQEVKASSTPTGSSGSTTTTTAAAGAFPGGTATTLTLTIGGVTVKTNLKTNVQTPADPVLNAKSGTSLSGSVSLDGTLPKGWSVVVFHLSGDDILLNTATGGAFSGVKPFATSFQGSTRPGAYICSTKVPPLCSPAAQANISISWAP